MRLRSLQLHGFKSFADRTSIEFRDGVTAIVGSNGCGKSNLADAIRWVLGEQRASAIRSGKMEDVIFGGTARRRPLNFAEISLLFSNDQGKVPIPQTEIEVARKTFREGGSEYALNRTGCRLRDIHNLLRDTGLGANAYSIIEAGMIETLLSDRAEERRILFDEAAGVGKYKDSRKATARRLEAAEGDLARLDDLVAEVEAKVRSLARQRRQAQRHQEFRARRLDLEVAVARGDLEALAGTLEAGERRQAELEGEGAAARAERAAAETLLEERRGESAELGRRRVVVAGQLDGVRRHLDEREREILLADERRSHAEMRISQLSRERTELETRLASLATQLGGLAKNRERVTRTLDALRERRETRDAANEALRADLAAQRKMAEAIVTRSRDLAREIATAEGERTAAEARRRDAEERLVRAERQERQFREELGRLAEQTELWSGRGEELEGCLAAAETAVGDTREDIRVLHEREAKARDALRTAEDSLSQLTSRITAHEALECSYEGFSPAVAAIMAAQERFPGIHGPLADFIENSGTAAATETIEVYLGALLQALVVEDLAAARAVRDWFRREWEGGGSLLLLPRDAPGLAELGAAPGAAGTGARGSGAGGAWVARLLADLIDAGEDDPLDAYAPGAARVGPGGDLVDARGLVRLVEHGSGEGILARREVLIRLRSERDAAKREHDDRLTDRQQLAASLAGVEGHAREAGERRRALQSELQRLQAETAAHAHRRTRLQGDREELSRTIATLRTAVSEAAARIQDREASLAGMNREANDVNAEVDDARTRLSEMEARWEVARDEQSELRVAVARAEADLRDADGRSTAATRAKGNARARIAAIDREATEPRTSLEGLSGVRERAGREIGGLCDARERHTSELQAVDVRIAEIGAEITKADERARATRRRERECSEERHRLELRNAESRSRTERIRERLEAEWGRPWKALVTAASPIGEGGPEQWNAEIRKVAGQLDGLGPINMLAMDEHEEEQQRLSFLREQRADLVKARDDLAAAIRQINRTARDVFMETFGAIRDNFGRTFASLFQGGECDVRLADPDDPLESPIEIQASPKGKRTQRIHLLSGGERTLTALALLFALYLVKPSPFCVLDEVDAPLDASNVGRFIQLLRDFKTETQFIVITHNPRTMEAADWIYGVTMEEPGISSIVGVELQGAWVMEDRVA